jgi:hypothetical protein
MRLQLSFLPRLRNNDLPLGLDDLILESNVM